MRETPFYASRDPGAQGAYQVRFYNTVGMEKLVAVGLVYGRKQPSAKGRKYFYP